MQPLHGSRVFAGALLTCLIVPGTPAVVWAQSDQVPGGAPCADSFDGGPGGCVLQPDPGDFMDPDEDCMVSAEGGCFPPTDTDTDSGDGETAAEAPPPPPPTAAEVEALLCPDSAVPASTIGRDPAGEGLTGLETRLWASPVTPISAAGDIRGYPVTCTMTPYEWSWDTGDGGYYTRGHHGGPHPDHAAEHVYETRNEPDEDYALTLTVRWRKIGSAALDRIVFTTHTEGYHVIEIRSTLTANP